MKPEELIKHFGGTVASAAQAIGVSTQAVRNWRRAKRIPKRSQAWIQLETGGALKADNGRGKK